MAAKKGNTGTVSPSLAQPPCDNPHCVRRIKELESELNRVRSVGLDMLKQRGNWHASGPKPEEMGLEFDSLFSHEVEEMSETLTKKSSMTTSEARQFLSTTFQDVYSTCKESILGMMHEALSRILTLPEEKEKDEELYDICRAYGLLVNATGVEKSDHYIKCSREVYSRLKIFNHSIRVTEFQDLTDKMSNLSWKMLSTVPPLVSADISDAPFSKEWHDREMEPDWNDRLLEPDYDLVYYRPILFFSYNGKVTQKGWVGNKAIDYGESDEKGSAAAMVSSEDDLKDVCAQDAKARSSERQERSKRVYKSYKKPILKIAEVGSSGPLFYPFSASGSESDQAEDFDLAVMVDSPYPDEEEKGNEKASTSLYGFDKFHVFKY